MPIWKQFVEELTGRKNPLGPRVTDVNPRERERLFFLLAMMFKCGHTTSEGLRAVAKAFRSEGKEDVSAALQAIAHRVSQGKSMSKAMESEHILFTDLHRAAVMAGEVSDNMEQSFDTLRTLEGKKIASSRAGIAELLTPLLMMVLSLVSIFNTGLNTLPVMAKVREAQGKPLGAIPSGIMDTTGFIADSWYFLAAFFSVIGVTLYSMHNSANGRITLHRWVLNIPVYGKFITYGTYTDMLLYFPYMLASGVKPKQMIPIMEALATNTILKRRIESFNQVITAGGSMSEAMTKAGFPEIAVTPVQVSENYSGNSDSGVNSVMIEGMQHAHGILEEMLADTHRKFVATFSSLLWCIGGAFMLLDMVSIVLSQG
ncbi:MAG: type II secretion system F family protein [Alphaproteobacteria bacterium]|nr:type II secretion system F family protein [Alphaproteobacteria bacterium]MDD9920051.1 type II secretion system F family protein [Alphaproteobacteria bacterium]